MITNGQVRVESPDGLLTFTVGETSPTTHAGGKKVIGFSFYDHVYPWVAINYDNDTYEEFNGYRYIYRKLKA